MKDTEEGYDGAMFDAGGKNNSLSVGKMTAKKLSMVPSNIKPFE